MSKTLPVCLQKYNRHRMELLALCLRRIWLLGTENIYIRQAEYSSKYERNFLIAEKVSGCAKFAFIAILAECLLRSCVRAFH